MYYESSLTKDLDEETFLFDFRDWLLDQGCDNSSANDIITIEREKLLGFAFDYGVIDKWHADF